MNMKPDTKMIEKWWKQASDEFAFTSDGEIRKRFSELAAQWGAEQAQQTTEETDAEMALRSIASWLGVGGFNALTFDAKVFERKIYEGVERAIKSYYVAAEEPELPEPVAWRFVDDEEVGYTAYQTAPPTQEQAAYLKKWNRPTWEPLYTPAQMHGHFAAGVRSGMGQSQDALGYAQRLAKSIASKEYPEVTQFEVLGDLMGVLSQIDNMTCGMTRVLQGGQQ